MGAFSTLTTPPPVIDGFSMKLDRWHCRRRRHLQDHPDPQRGDEHQDRDDRHQTSGHRRTVERGHCAGRQRHLDHSVQRQPTLTTNLDIYDPATTAAIQSGIKNSMPVKVVFGAAGGTSQTYQLLDAKGVMISSGTIVPDQNNTLSLSVPLRSMPGCADHGPGPPAVQRTATFDMTMAGIAGQRQRDRHQRRSARHDGQP